MAVLFLRSSVVVWSCFGDLVESVVVVVVGEVVLVPVLVPVEFASSAGMHSSRTWFLPTGGDERHGHQDGG